MSSFLRTDALIKTLWIEPGPLGDDIPRLHPDPLLHELLARRGISHVTEATAFLDQRPRHAPDPEGLPNLQAAVERIGAALDRGERIGIFGDYDADGVTATAVIVHALRQAAKSPDLVIAILPTREQGYGLNKFSIAAFAEVGVTLLVAVDCGSSDPVHVSQALASGLDVVILDHHQIAGDPPDDAIVVSAQLPGGERFADLCAVGVAFMVVAALARDGYRIDGDEGEPETALLDLVALGTIADMVPLVGINRPLVRDGLRQLGKGLRPGLAALCRRAGVNLANVSSEQMVFKIGPRLNAAGRMGDPRLALDLLLERDPLRATHMADEIEQLNERRRADSARIYREAESMIALQPERLSSRLLVLAGRHWPSGLLGPVASQLVERYFRPVIVLSDDGDISHGSARSVPGLDIAAALRRCESMLIRIGGHEQAAGLALQTRRISELADAMDRVIEEAGIDVPFHPFIQLDAELPVERLNLATTHLLQSLEPFGKGNEQPVVLVRNVAVRQWDVVGADRRHLRLQLGTPAGIAKAIAFGLAERSRELVSGRNVDIAAVLKIDNWNGQRKLDLEIRDFRPAT